MKRCPLCDFIYEDDQGRCDMDGIELIPDHRTAPFREEAAARSAKSRWRRFTTLPVAGVILGIALFPAYYVITRWAAPQNTERPSAKVAADSPVPYRSPATDVKVTDSPAPPAPPQPTPDPSPTPRPDEKKSKRRGEKRTEPKRGKDKKESSLGSILKKTGRILKKPFKL